MSNHRPTLGAHETAPKNNRFTTRRPSAGPQSWASNSAIEQLLRREDGCETLTIKMRKLEELIASGELPVVRIGRAVRIRPEDLRRFIAKQTNGRRA